MADRQHQRACAPRRTYRSIEQARTAAASIAARCGPHRLPEACQHCNGWHLR